MSRPATNAEAGIGDPANLFRDIDLASRRSVAVAVSGGGNSVALLHLLDDYLRMMAAPPKLVAITVDHGLRAESAAEAAWVHYLCEARDIAHRVVRWDGAKPDTGVPAAAREARYRLLAAAAKAGASDLLLTGHTLDDQVETHLMRRARSGRGPGLAGMAPATLFDRSTWILRPLLSVGRGDLRRYLVARNMPWIDDPTNEDLNYERVRVRKDAASQRAERSAVEIGHAQAARRANAVKAAAFVAECVRLEPDGSVAVALDALQARDNSAVALALAALTAAVGGQGLPVNGRDSERLHAFCTGSTDEAKGASGRPRMTLGRCVFERDGDQLRLWRERRNLPEIVVGPSQSAVWDGRYAFRNTDPLRSFVIGPHARSVRRRDAAAAEPAIRLRAEAEDMPDSDELSARDGALEVDRYLSQFDHFLPEFDIVLADAVAALFGRAPFPEPPVHRVRRN